MTPVWCGHYSKLLFCEFHGLGKATHYEEFSSMLQLIDLAGSDSTEVTTNGYELASATCVEEFKYFFMLPVTGLIWANTMSVQKKMSLMKNETLKNTFLRWSLGLTLY